MATEVVKNLKNARALLANNGWCTRFFAIDKEQYPVVNLQDERAVQFCLSGAIAKVKGNYSGDYAYSSSERRALQETLTSMDDYRSPEQFNNDQGNVEPVLQLIDATITRLEGENADAR